MEPSGLPELTDEAETLGDQGVSHRREGAQRELQRYSEVPLSIHQYMHVKKLRDNWRTKKIRGNYIQCQTGPV